MAIILLTLMRPFFCLEFYLEIVQTLFCACPLPLMDCSLSVDHLHATHANPPSPHRPHPPLPSPSVSTPCPLTCCTSNHADDPQMACPSPANATPQVHGTSTAVIPTSHICTQHRIFPPSLPYGLLLVWPC